MEHNGKKLELLADDGQGNRLWVDRTCGLVANESYDTETDETFGLDNNIEGWGHYPCDCLLALEE